jgi:hypothetical protein
MRANTVDEVPTADIPAMKMSLRLTIPVSKRADNLLASSSSPRSNRQRVLADSEVKGSDELTVIEFLDELKCSIPSIVKAEGCEL